MTRLRCEFRVIISQQGGGVRGKVKGATRACTRKRTYNFVPQSCSLLSNSEQPQIYIKIIQILVAVSVSKPDSKQYRISATEHSTAWTAGNKNNISTNN
jgi:hypothetical protein